MFRPLLNAVMLCLLATPALADPTTILRIEAALAAPGLAPGIDARATDIVTIERIPGDNPSLLVKLHPSFDSAMVDLTKDRAGQRLIITVCDRVVMEPLLDGPLPDAAIVLSAYDPQFLAEVEASLRSATCDGVPVG
jgi:hypothetical protein